MAKGTRKTKKKKELDYGAQLATWKGFLAWLKDQTDEVLVRDAMLYEIAHQNRPQFIDRARTRFNKLRTYRELKELEKLSGKTISINYV